MTSKKTPLFLSIYRDLRKKYNHYRLKLTDIETVFTTIYTTNKWKGTDSVSGPGSDTLHTKVISKKLPILLADLQVKTLMDIPCGDFFWMKNIKLDTIQYTGADIVGILIDKNNKLYATENIHFRKLNMLTDPLPQTTAILCRDCLVHFSFTDIFQALQNIFNSNSHYLLTTTFTDRETNSNIATGNWRALNLQAPPFSFPSPIKLINEGSLEASGSQKDKALGVWKISELRRHFENKHS